MFSSLGFMLAILNIFGWILYAYEIQYFIIILGISAVLVQLDLLTKTVKGSEKE